MPTAMVPIAIIAAALMHFAPTARWDDAMQGRPISWDQLGLYPLDYPKKLDPEDQAEIDLLRKGEGSEVRARALARLRLHSENLVAGWIYGQTARIGKNPDEALRLLEPLKNKHGVGVDYAQLKCERIKCLSLMIKPGVVPQPVLDYESALRTDAKAVWDRNPDAPELLPLYVDILEPDDARAILTDYAGRHKPDRVVKLQMARSYVGGWVSVNPATKQAQTPDPNVVVANSRAPWLARPILEDLLKSNANDGAANYYLATLYATTDKPKQAVGLFRWLIKNSDLTDPMLERARAYLADPRAGSLYPFPPIE